MNRMWFKVAAVLTSVMCLAQDKPAEKLPVHRVILYKNGVGYFEHSGRVRGDQELKIDFTSPQLNDVLKSLTVLDLGGGRITGVGYNSVAPISEQLKSLRLPLGEASTLAGFLAALRGARIQIRNGTLAVSGRLLSVEEKTVKKDAEEHKTLQIAVVTDAGEIRTFPVSDSLGVKVADHDLSEEISRYLSLVGSARDQEVRRMTISTAGAGERNIFVSYISEVPVWKSTYRIILPSKSEAQPLLQGWAIVDNTVGEDWKDVELSLVAGAPQSFIQELSRPYYARRPVVEMPEAMMLTPQTHEGTLRNEPLDSEAVPEPSVSPGVVGGVPGGSSGGVIGGVVGSARLSTGAPAASFTGIYGVVRDAAGAALANARVRATNAAGVSQSTFSDATGAFRFGLNSGVYEVRVEMPGFAAALQKDVRVASGSPAYRSYTLSVASVAHTVEVASEAEKEESEATAGGLGDLFEYKLKERVTILKNRSALVPIIHSHIDAEKVTLWNKDQGHPLRALWIRNSSGLTLDSGTFNVMENNAFAGEGLIHPLKPQERRLVSFAVDQAVRVAESHDLEPRPVTHVKIARGVMVRTSEQRDHTIYTVRNTDGQARQVILEHPVRDGWKLAGDVKPEETSTSAYRLRLNVPAEKSAVLRIDESLPLEQTVALASITDDQIKFWSSERTLKPAVEQALRRIIDKKNEIARFDAELQTRASEINSIDRDQQRLRENMKALKGSVEEKALLQRYTGELNSQEDRLKVIHREITVLEKSRDEAREQLDHTLLEMTLDEDV